jgi:hypothetical protein
MLPLSSPPFSLRVVGVCLTELVGSQVPVVLEVSLRVSVAFSAAEFPEDGVDEEASGVSERTGTASGWGRGLSERRSESPRSSMR